MPLTDAEIEARLGPLLREGIWAFRNQPDYLCEMAEKAAWMKSQGQILRPSPWDREKMSR